MLEGDGGSHPVFPEAFWGGEGVMPGRVETTADPGR